MFIIITNHPANYIGKNFRLDKGTFSIHFTSEIKEAKTFNTDTEADNFAKQIITFAQITLDRDLYNKIVGYRIIKI